MSEINSTQTELLDDKILANDIESELSNRFIAYALSTIISRSLPDIRDGLKPVHRRIMFAMKEMRLSADQRFRKAAAVVGNVIGKFHPHGDQAVYDAMVRLAQDFSLRYPLVEGQGNFGNIDGDSAAAMRYTEVKLTKLAGELLREIDQGTVTFKETYDQRATEPELLPARIPNLLINGTTGIAVGLATSFPPHNLGEIIDALLILVDNRNSTLADILKVVKGPDFPTYGEIVASKNELLDIYQTGKGGLKTHGQWHVEKGKKGRFNIIIDSIPYSVNKSRLIEKIADIIRSKRLTDIVDIRDESTDIVRILLEPRSATVNPNKVIAYLFKHSELQINYQLNLTALTKETVPKRHSLKEALIAFLDFRIETIIKRTQFRINKLTDRLKILEALVKIYNNIDKTIEIIKRSKTKDEARSKLISSFKLDEIQANAILDLRLASIVGLEIAKIQDEEKSAKNELKQLNLLINSKARLRKLVKNEFMQLKNEYGDKRRTVIKSTQKEEIEYDEDSYIVDEECEVIISKHGLAKRIKQLKDLSTLRFK
ncbi:MAG: DNA topoisomerase (ATP-hydrolyzing), partial [Nitrospinota bacterium]